jgi:hypothetical protein
VSLTRGQQAGSYYARKRNRAAVLTNDPTQRAWGSVLFSTNVAQTVTLGGTVVTFGTSFALGANLAVTLQNLLTYLNASLDANLVKATYSVSAMILSVRAKSVNDATFTLAASVGVRSNPTLHLIQTRQRGS